jgi:uncharacterized membrane protein
LIFCIFSIGIALLASSLDNSFLKDFVPEVEKESLEDLLKIISSSMLVISIFSVTSMLSAFTSAANTATPRSFKLVIADDVSQNALSVFIGSFIFSIVALVAFKNEYYGKVGIFILFLMTLILFISVILVFLRWVDRVSRLGRMEHTIDQVETATANAISSKLQLQTKRTDLSKDHDSSESIPIFSDKIGHLQNINASKIQSLLEKVEGTITFVNKPGDFLKLKEAIAFIETKQLDDKDEFLKNIMESISIGKARLFDVDPDFGFIALSEIASRALSPGVNDPGTAIEILRTYTRLFYRLHTTEEENESIDEVEYDRISIPRESKEVFFTNAFRPIARDGSGNIEVMLQMQKTLAFIADLDNKELTKLAKLHSKQAFERAKESLTYEGDIEALEKQKL